MTLPRWVHRLLLRAALRVAMAREADFELPGYLRRWHLVRTRWGCLYVHQIIGSDDDRALHDHRSWNVSVLLSGSYLEHLMDDARHRMAGDVVARRATTPHRLELTGMPTLTLFLTGPHQRHWGFVTEAGWTRHVEFLEARAAETGAS